MTFLQFKVNQGLVDDELLYHLSQLENFERAGNGLSHSERDLKKSIIDRLDKLTKPRSHADQALSVISESVAPDIHIGFNATLLVNPNSKGSIGWSAELKSLTDSRPLTDDEFDRSKDLLLAAATSVKSLADIGPDRLCYDFFLDKIPDESIHEVRRVIEYLLRLADERIEDIEIEKKSDAKACR